MDVGVLVAALVLDEVVDVHAHFTGHRLGVVDADHDAVGVDIVHHAAAAGGHHGTGVHCRHTLHARAYEGLFRAQCRHRLALHVGAHQRAVGIVVLQEGHERSRHRDDLRRGHVHVLHALGRDQHRFTLLTRAHQLIHQLAGVVQRGVGLGNDVLAFLDGGQVIDLVGHLAVHHAPVRGLEEAVLVELREQRQRVDQADVRAFRGLDRAHTAVVRGVHVTHLEAGTLAGQAAWAQGGNAPLVRDLRQRVGLVHELRQLRGTEELLEGRRNRLGVDQVMRHQGLGLGLTQTLLHGFLDSSQARAVLVFGQLAHAAHASVAQVVDVVHIAVTVAQVHQDLDDVQDVLVGQRHRTFRHITAHAGVELHAAHARQVVGVGVVEEPVEQRLHRVFRGRLAGAHHAVDRHTRGELVGGLIYRQGLADVRALVQLVGEQAGQILDAGAAQLLQQRLGELVVGLGHDLPSVGVDHVARHDPAQEEVLGHRDQVGAGLLQLTQMPHGDALVLLDHDGTGLVGDVETRHLTAQALGHELHLRARVHELEVVVDEEVAQDGLRLQADGLEQDRHRHLATAVDTEVQDVLGIELEVQPGAAIRDDPGREQQLARAVGLALVMLEEHARRAVQLADDDALGAVDDERAVVGHQGHFAHVDLLLLDLLDDLGGVRLAVVDDHLQLGAHGRCEVQATLLALAHIEGRLGHVVFDEAHLHEPVVRDDRECGLERRLQALRLALGGGDVLLQEAHIGLALHRQQVRDLEDALALAEALANSLALGVAVVRGCLRHESLRVDCSRLKVTEAKVGDWLLGHCVQ